LILSLFYQWEDCCIDQPSSEEGKALPTRSGCLSRFGFWLHKNKGIFVYSADDFWCISFSALFIFKVLERLLFKLLEDDPMANVTIPSEDEIHGYQAVMRENFPALDRAWCAMDRLKIPIQKSGDEYTQKALYSGWIMTT
jgi:hypothetical protein